MAAYNKFNVFTEDVDEKVHNLGADTLKIMLTNTAPIAANAVKADITQVANGGGYTTDGNAITITASLQTAGTYKLTGNDVVFTATTGFGPFRYAVFYNSTPAAGPLIAWWDYGSSITLLAGETFTIDLDQANGIFTLV